MPVFFYEFFLILKINASSFCIFRTYTLGASSFIFFYIYKAFKE
nr:MAG TPA: hypothetical protein [Bacteriophage sp.]